MNRLGWLIFAIGSFFLAGCSPNGSIIEDGFLGGVKISGERSRVSSARSSLTVGEGATVTLEIRDNNGFPYYIPNSNPTVVFYVSSGPGSGSFTSVTNHRNGTYSASFYGVGAGNVTISASIDGLVIPSTASILVSPGTFSTANSYVSLSAGTVASGSSVSVTLYTRDSSNNPVYTSGLSVSFNLSGGTSTGTFSATTDNGDGSYSATFTGVLAGSASQVRGVIGATPLTSAAPSVTVTAGAASQISVSSGGSQSGTVGVALGSPLVALVTDAAGNPVNGATVNWTRSGGSLASASGTTNASGLASNTFTLGTLAGSYTATATIQGTSTSVDFNATASAGAATQLSFSSQPSSPTVASVPFATQPVIDILDTYGNRVTNGADATATITLSLQQGTGALGGTVAMAAVAGRADFSGKGLNLDLSGTNKILRATKADTTGSGGSGSLTVDSNVFTITHGAASTVAFTTQPGGGVAGTSWAQQPVAEIRDAFGNRITTGVDATASVSLALTTGSGTLSGTATVAAVGGVATFSGLSINLTGTNKVLTATKADTTGSGGTVAASAGSGSFTITHAAASQLFYTTQPVGGVAEGALLSAQPTLEIRDTYGNRVTSGPDATASVSLSLTSGTGSLGGTTSMAAVGGVAAFTDISVSFSGNKVITATKANTTGSGGTASVSLASSAFTVNDTISPSAPGTPSWSASVWGSTSTTPTLSWTAATDTNGSGISHYEVALGTSAGATNTVGWTNVGNVISYSFSGLSLSNGTSYFASVRAVDGAANAGSPANSAAFAVDSTSPAAPTSVTDGSVTTNLGATPAISWVASASAASPNFGGYELAIGTTAGGTDTLAWIDVGNVTTYTPSTGITLIDGTAYYATVRAYKTTGLRSSAANGDGFVANTSSPSLTCDFITSGATECRENGLALAPLLRLGRAGGSNTSPGTYVDSAGVIRNAPTNLLLRSEEPDVSPWIRTGLNAFGSGSVINTSAVKDPSGGNGAEYLQEDTSSTNHGVYQNITASPAVSYTCSVFAKAAERQFVRMVLTDGAGSNYVEGYFDLGSGTTGGLGYNGGGNSGSLGISTYPNGWYRLRISGIPATSGTTTGCNIRMVRNVGDTVYAGNGVSGLYVWGAQLETGVSASSYIYTSSAAGYGPRIDHDPSNCPSGVCARKGLLLEGARSNLVANSAGTTGQTPGNSGSTTYTVSSELAPDGSGNFLKCTEGGAGFGSVSHACRWLITMAASTTYTASAYVKAAGRTEFTMLAYDNSANGSVKFDLTNSTAAHCNTGLSSSSGIKAVGNGVYRVWVTFTTPASPASNYFDFRLADGGAYGCVGDVYTGDGSSGLYIWGVQLEAGNFPSSYIPTSGGTRTRNADSAFTPGVGWLDSARGSLLVSGGITESTSISPGTFPFLASLSDSSAGTNDVSLYFREANSSKACRINRSGATEFTGNIPHSFSSTANLAVAYQASDASCYGDGSSIGSSTSSGVPVVNGLYLGSTGTSVPFFVHVRSVNYYNSRLNDSKLRYLTVP